MKRAFLASLILLPSFALLPASIRAQDPTGGNAADVPPTVAQLFSDLAAIPSGAEVTDDQHQALVADLNALATGLFTPDPDELDQLASDLGSAAAAGLVTPDFEAELVADFDLDPADYDETDDSDGWLDDIEDDVSCVLNPVDDSDPVGTDPILTFPGGVFPPGIFLPGVVYTTALAGHPALVSGSYSHAALPLTAQGIPPFLLENYSGHIRLGTRRYPGAATVSTLAVRASGLPPINPYTVSITRQSDGAAVVIGKLHVQNNFHFLISAAGTALVSPAAEFASSAHAIFGGTNGGKALPAGFHADDVAGVTLTDAQGIVRLSGSVAGVQPTRSIQGASLRLTNPSTVVATAASANAVVRHAVVGAKTTDTFHLSAHHLPANTTVSLAVNGASVGTFQTSAKGRLIIVEGRPMASAKASALPAGVDLSAVKSLSLTDTQGNVLIIGSL